MSKWNIIIYKTTQLASNPSIKQLLLFTCLLSPFSLPDELQLPVTSRCEPIENYWAASDQQDVEWVSSESQRCGPSTDCRQQATGVMVEWAVSCTGVYRHHTLRWPCRVLCVLSPVPVCVYSTTHIPLCTMYQSEGSVSVTMPSNSKLIDIIFPG